MKPTDIHIDDVSFSFEDFLYRTPIKFGGVASDRITLLNVTVHVRTRAGQRSSGFGSMPMGNIWSFPSKTLGYDCTLAVMKTLADRIAGITRSCTEAGHPIDLAHVLEPECHRAAAELSQSLPESIPALCTLVVASPFDAALHDAFGKVHSLNCYHTYGSDFMNHDLSHFLGPDFAGESLAQYISTAPVPRLPLYHLVGALDPLEKADADLFRFVNDGLPNTLGEWIAYNGLTHLKIKLNGDDLAWDVNRVLAVERAAAVVQVARSVSRWHYSLDFNERCPNVAYLLDFLREVREQAPAAFDRIAYIEQPTARDLKVDRHNVMREAARLRPVVIDESLLDLESLLLARDMGYTGVALKACKGQSQSLLLAAAAQKHGMFLCVQDLTCPGASLIHSAGLAAHVPGVSAIEANARQFCPAANAPWEAGFPGIFHITDGMMETGCLTGIGLGAVP